MENYILLAKLFFVCWFITRFEPIQWFIELLPNSFIKNIIIILTTCLKCCSFWLSLAFTGDIFIASIMAFVGMLYEKTIGKWETTIKFN
jgi:hypothetical protein